MKKYTKYVALIAVAALACTCLIACSKKNAAEESSAAEPSTVNTAEEEEAEEEEDTEKDDDETGETDSSEASPSDDKEADSGQKTVQAAKQVYFTVTDVQDYFVAAELNNQTDEEITYGFEYSIEQEVNGEWEKLEVIDDSIGFNEIAMLLEPGDTAVLGNDISLLYGELGAGHYRMVLGEWWSDFYLDDAGCLSLMK